jgi:DNA-binding NarL/FixJ family response regulator
MRHAADPPPKVVVVTMIEDPRQVRDLMELGASAYVVKSASTEHLIAAVRAAILDPKSKNAVVGMPRGCSKKRRGARRACSRPGSSRYCCWRPGASPTAS